jgi:hypothetical protein
MSICDLHSAVLADYHDFVRSFLSIADERARQFVEHALVDEARLWLDSLLQVSPAYARDTMVDELAERRMLYDTTARIFRTSEGHPFHLYHHQLEALEKAQGTPQGKLRCDEWYEFRQKPDLFFAYHRRPAPAVIPSAVPIEVFGQVVDSWIYKHLYLCARSQRTSGLPSRPAPVLVRLNTFLRFCKT